ncbi:MULTISPECIES: I78 family peptidase inhibitor [Streptomycetaceae]|uniref:I78 family peptidase inhibitor n=1 Tax=Streptomycetaceae TaxID=2062 RepID=UPI0030087264
MGPQPNPQDRNPDDNLDAYLGLPAAEAEARARAHGWTTVRSLPPGTVVTMEFVLGRLNFIVAEGRVQRCWLG